MFTYPIVGISESGPQLPVGLVSWWELEEASGTRVDSHGSNDLTLTGAELGNRTGVFGNARDTFNNNVNRLVSGTDLAGNGSFTVGGLFYADAVPGANTPAYLAGRTDLGSTSSSNRDWYFGFINTTLPTLVRMVGYVSGSAYNATSTVVAADMLNSWHLYVGIWDADNLRLGVSVDNEAIVWTTTPGLISTAGDSFVLGKGATSTNWYADGAQDEWWYYNRALSQDEIGYFWNNGNFRGYPG